MRRRLAGVVLVLAAACAAPEYRVYGDHVPTAPGDRAVVCAVEVRGARWTLAATVQHLAVRDDGRVTVRTARDARSACRALLWEQGVLTDTLPVREIEWTLRRGRRGPDTAGGRSIVSTPAGSPDTDPCGVRRLA